jgi:hypothetical protein
MEANALKKTMLYLFAATILGLVLILVPLIAVKTDVTYYGLTAELFGESAAAREESLRGAWGLTTPALSFVDCSFIAFSFVVASAVYLVFRRKMLH